MGCNPILQRVCLLPLFSMKAVSLASSPSWLELMLTFVVNEPNHMAKVAPILQHGQTKRSL